MNIEEFITELQKLNINLSETQISMLITYKNLILRLLLKMKTFI